MPRGLLIWNILLTLAAGYLLIMQFGTGAKKSFKGMGSNTDTLKNSGEFRMAYFEMDSVASNFDLVKEVKAELSKKEEEINRQIESLSKNLQQKYKYYQNQAESGSLTQAQMDAAGADIKKLDEEIKARKQQLDQEYNDLMMRRQGEIKSKIEAFLKDYNKKKNFSYIISYEQGLFYYKDSAYNITADVVKGLNEMYKPVKKN